MRFNIIFAALTWSHILCLSELQVGRWNGEPPLSKDTLQHLDAGYVARAEKDVALQLSKTGVGMAAVLNKAFGRRNLNIGLRIRHQPLPGPFPQLKVLRPREGAGRAAVRDPMRFSSS
jgi:hypothetical protein